MASALHQMGLKPQAPRRSQGAAVRTGGVAAAEVEWTLDGLQQA